MSSPITVSGHAESLGNVDVHVGSSNPPPCASGRRLVREVGDLHDVDTNRGTPPSRNTARPTQRYTEGKIEYERLDEVRTAIMRQLAAMSREYAQTSIHDNRKIKQLEDTLKAVDARCSEIDRRPPVPRVSLADFLTDLHHGSTTLLNASESFGRRASASSSLLYGPIDDGTEEDEEGPEVGHAARVSQLRMASRNFLGQPQVFLTRTSRSVRERPGSACGAAQQVVKTTSGGDAARPTVRVSVRRVVRPFSAAPSTGTSSNHPEPPLRAALRLRRDLAMARHAGVGTPPTPTVPLTAKQLRSHSCNSSAGSIMQKSSWPRASSMSGSSGRDSNAWRSTATSTGPHHDADSTVVQRLKEKGNDLFGSGEYVKAIDAYTETLRIDPLNEVLSSNRAAAYLLNGQFGAALAECHYVLLRSPQHMKANWRAAKAYLYTHRLPETRRHYRAAAKACENRQPPPADASSTQGRSCGPAPSGGHTQHIKQLKEKNTVMLEEGTLDQVDQYWQHMRSEQWIAATACAEKLMSVFGHTGPASLPWQLRHLEGLLHTDSQAALEKVQALQRGASARFMDLYYVHAKALFYCSHDSHSTRQCLTLLQDGFKAIEAENTVVEANVRLYAQWLRARRTSETVDVSAWLVMFGMQPDSRAVQLRHTIEAFEKARDDGNNAYAAGNWHAAHHAYTQCLAADPANRSLMGTTYCNRSAVCMQAGRWKDALSDANQAISYVSGNAKALARRARIHMHFFQQAQNSLSTPAGSAERSIKAALEDLRLVQQLSPSPESARQLDDCTAQWMRFQVQRPQSGASNSGGGARRSSFGSGIFHSFRASPKANPNGSERAGASASNRENVNSGTNSRSQSVPGGGSTSRTSRESYLKLLGLPATARVEFSTLVKAYRGAALRWHPDKWVNASIAEREHAERHFKSISVAYHSLKDGYC